MTTAKVFKSGNSQAVRLPKEFQFREKELHIRRMGRSIVLTPKHKSWKALFNALEGMPEDFMEDRTDLPPQEREDIFE